jgi:hypothetical protein
MCRYLLPGIMRKPKQEKPILIRYFDEFTLSWIYRNR